MAVKKIKIENIIPDQRNTNKHTEYGMYALENSIELLSNF
jgi:hypothetical protein